MYVIITILSWIAIIWAVEKVIDLIIEITPIWGDGIDDKDIEWWIKRPFSFRMYSIPQGGFSMAVGALIWVVMIALAVFGLIIVI